MRARLSGSAYESFRGAGSYRGGHMKRIILTSLSLAALVVIASAAASRAEESATVSPRDLDAKINYCKTCHGTNGQGFRGAYPMPRLAGQQTEYLENQLQAFIDRRRTNPVMFNVAHVLSPAMLKGLATHFKDLNPKPLGGAPRELANAGKKSTMKAFPKPMSRLVRRATAPRPRERGRFPAWPVSLTTMSSTSWRTGAGSEARTNQSPTLRRSWSRSRTG